MNDASKHEDAKASNNELCLRDDLILHEQDRQSGRGILEDPSETKFFRLGEQEYLLISQLQTHDDPLDAVETYYRLSSENSRESLLTTQQVKELFDWLVKNGLTKHSNGVSSEASRNNSSSPKNPLSHFYFLKLPLLNPDSLLNKLRPLISWCFSWQVSLVGLATFFFGLLVVAGQWSEFLSSYQNLFTPWRGFWLLVSWFVLKLLHELGHAMTCKRYGGSVPDAGLALILMVPMAYVDVTTSWRFSTRWKRLHVTMAGLVVELTIAGIALLVWYGTESVAIKQAAADVILLAAVSSVLFNLNPLMRFDGYFALTDVTGIDNLYQYGQLYARYWGARYLLGLAPSPPSLPKKHENWIKVYGIAAAAYRCVTVAGLITGAAALFHGAGIVIAVVGVFSFVLHPLVKLLISLGKLYQQGEVQLGRLVCRLGLLSAFVVMLLFALPGELRQTMPGIIEYDPPMVVRSPSDAFIEQVYVRDGQLVKQGDILLSLGNDELMSEQALLRKEMQQTEQKLRSARWERDSATVEELDAQLNNLQSQMVEVSEQVQQLQVIAPSDGRVVARRLESFEGTFANQGDELLAIGLESRKRVRVSLSQWEASRIDEWSDRPILVHVHGRRNWTGEMSTIESHASNIPSELSLCASNGGSLPVIQTVDGPRLTEPRVNAFIGLTSRQASEVKSGQRCYVRLDSSRKSLATLLASTVREFLPW